MFNRRSILIWLELRFWDLIMWLDHRLEGHPLWRRICVRLPQTLHDLPSQPAIQTGLTLTASIALGFAIGWMIF